MGGRHFNEHASMLALLPRALCNVQYRQAQAAVSILLLYCRASLQKAWPLMQKGRALDSPFSR